MPIRGPFFEIASLYRPRVQPPSEPIRPRTLLAEHRFEFGLRGRQIFFDNEVIADQGNFRRMDIRDALIAVNRVLSDFKVSPSILKAEILGDEESIPFVEYCARELLVNAFDAIHDNGTVRLIVRNFQDGIEILCEDNGGGIKHPEKLFKLSESYKAGNLIKDRRQSGGSGVALYFIKKTLKYLGGEINVLETGPRGTRFQVSLPKSLPKWKTARKIYVSTQVFFRLLAHGPDMT